MNQNPSIPLAAVIGHPIAHSKSPALHGYWLRRYRIRGHYIPLDIAPEDLEESLRLLPRIGFVGANITIPHKERALEIADIVAERAAAIGAANTLSFGADGRIQADNTDGIGFMANLWQSAPDWRPSRGPACVLGAGGASRAIIFALIEAGVPEIRLTNRTRARAEELKAAFGPLITIHDWEARDRMLEDSATLVNTTSLGMNGKPELEIDLTRLPTSALVTDLVYTPLKTALLHRAEVHGCRIVDGLGMLIHQAAPGFERWFGCAPEVDEAVRQAVLLA